MKKPKQKYLWLIAGILLSLSACYPAGYEYKDLTLEEIIGSWEGVSPIFAGYCRLDIDKQGKGYFILIHQEDDINVSEVQSIQFAGREVVIRLKEFDLKDKKYSDESYLLSGYIWSDRILLELSEEKSNNNQSKPETIWLPLIRFTTFSELKEIADNLLIQLKENKT